MSGWRKRQIENMMYESGLTADGSFSDMDLYDQNAIQKFGELLVEKTIKDVLEIINDPTVYNRVVLTTYDKGVADGAAGLIAKRITETFGVSSASGISSPSQFTEVNYQKAVEKRNGFR